MTPRRAGPARLALEGHAPGDFASTVTACRQALAAEGFGVLTEIDLAAKLREKLGVERAPYLILGACHPPSAHRVTTAAPEIGVILPCNVCVSLEDGATVVRALDPRGVMGTIDNPEVRAVAQEMAAALERVLRAVCG